jgi:hypothetical protein
MEVYMSNMVFQVLPDPDSYGSRFRFAQKVNGRVSKIGVVSFEEYDPSTKLPDNCGFGVEKDDLQALADMLWEFGIKPTGATGGVSKELFDATVSHLNDLRKLVIFLIDRI